MICLESFDFGINFIAFLEEKPVGYLLSSIKQKDNEFVAEMWLPIVKYGCEEAIKLLIDQALKTYKERGIRKVETNQGSEWDHLQGIPEQFGFIRTEDMVVTVLKKVEEFDIVDYPSLDLEPIDSSKHSQAIVDYYKEKYHENEATARNFIENRLVKFDTTFVLMEDNHLKAILRFYLFDKPSNPEEIRKIMWVRKMELREPFADEVIRGLFRFSVEFAKEKGFEIIDFNVAADDEEALYQFQAINEKPQSHRYTYELQLD